MPSEAQRARQQEVYGAELLMDLIEGREPKPDHLKWLEMDWEPGYRWAESGGSWNHDQILASARLWLRADSIAIAWIIGYLRAQLGERKSPAYPTLEFFGGTEQLSNTYEGWRWGCVLSWRLLALRFPEHPASKEILRLTARYNEAQTALLALGASPRPTRMGLVAWPSGSGQLNSLTNPHANARGKLWWEGPSLPVSGNRSTPAHVGQDDRAPLYDWYRGIDNPPYARERFGWPESILRLVTDGFRKLPDAGFDEETAPENFRMALEGIRLLVPHHFAHWREEGVRTNWIENMTNGNTTSILGHVMLEREGTATYLFPWPGRIRGRKGQEGPGPASCEMVAPNPDTGQPRELVARSRFGEVRCELPERDPDSHVVMGPEGLEVLR